AWSGDFCRGRGGLLQLLGMSLSPCCRFPPAEVKVPPRSDFGTPCCLRPSVAGSALGFTHFRGHLRVHCCYGPVTRNLPWGDLVDRLQGLGFPPPCYPNYGAPDSGPGRSFSCCTCQPSLDPQPAVNLAPHPAPTLQPPVARQAATGRTDWGPVARCIPANASMLVPGV